MTEPGRSRPSLISPRSVSERQKVPCGTCGRGVDPLRAPLVAVFGQRFYYFCGPECRARFEPEQAQPVTAQPVAPAPSAGPPPARPSPQTDLDAAPPTWRAGSTEEPPADSVGRAEGSESWGSAPRPWASLGALALALGALAAAFAPPPGAPLWRAPLAAAVACAALLAAAQGRAPRPACAFALPPLVAALVGLLASWLEPASAPLAARIASVVCAVAAASQLWLAYARRALEVKLSLLSAALDGAAGASSGRAQPGQEIVLGVGDRVPADVVVTAGRAEVEPWFGSRRRQLRGEGETLFAGGRVLEGELRARVRSAGDDRAWARLTRDPSRRADRHAALPRLAGQIAGRGAGGLGLAAFALALAFDVPPLAAAAHAAAVAAALCNVGLAERAGLHMAAGVQRLLARGVCLRSASALDRAARATAVVFCDRGTLLEAEPSVASVEPCAPLGEDALLALLAGAHAGVASPLASALSRLLAAQKLRPDAARSPSHLAGLGVIAVASNGQRLVAGTRALLLEHRVSVASAEARIAELEALGRSVVLVALEGRLVGLVALQNTLRPGARAATQSLLDAGIEPILLSGEARETCHALVRPIGIEQVHPEVLPQDRASEVQRLVLSRGQLAVIGSAADDAALGAAPLSINVDARGGPLERADVDVASGDLRDAAAALQLTRAHDGELRFALFAALAPTAAGLVLLLMGMPAWGLPALGLAGAALLPGSPRAPHDT